MDKFYIIYTKKVAVQLREKGFRIVRVGVNPHHPQYDTYIFEDTQKFQDALHEITLNNRK